MTSFPRSQSAAPPRSKPRKIQKTNKLIKTFLPATAKSNVQWPRTQSQPASLALALTLADPSLQAWKPPASVVSLAPTQPETVGLPSTQPEMFGLPSTQPETSTKLSDADEFSWRATDRTETDKKRLDQFEYWARAYDNCEWLCDRQAVRIRLQGLADWHSDSEEPVPFAAWSSSPGNRLTVVPDRSWDHRDHATGLCHATVSVTHAANGAPIWSHASLVAFVSLAASTSNRVLFHDSTSSSSSSSHGGLAATAFQLWLVRHPAKQCWVAELSAVGNDAAKPCKIDLELTVFYF